MRRSLWPKAVRAVEKFLLVDRFQHHGDCPLQHLVLEGGDAERPFLPIALRDVDASHGRCSVRAGLRAVEQTPEVTLQICRVLLRGLPVDARGSVLARASVRLAQPCQVDVMRQRRERFVAHALCQLRYPFEFR